MNNFDTLRASLASGPTPGPWISWRDANGRMHVGPATCESIADLNHPPGFGCIGGNATMIAAADPATIAALLAALDEARRDAERLRRAAEVVIAFNRQEAADRYGSASKAESWGCVVVLRAAMKATP